MSAARHALVFDCDGAIPQVVSDLLLDMGYRVSLATDVTALRAFLDTPSHVDLVVLEAGVSDAEVNSLVTLAEDRGIRIVMISGDLGLIQAYNERTDLLLRKPFGRERLRRAVEHAFASDVCGRRSADPD